MKPRIRQRVAKLLSAPATRSLTSRLPRWSGVLVLTYHRVGDSATEPWDRSLWSANADMFDAHVAALSRGADIVSPADLPALARARHRGRMVLITFDDGYRDNYEIAFPILRSHGVTATFFVSTGALDRPRVPWWDEIAWMVRNSARVTLEGVLAGHQELTCAPPQDDVTIARLVAKYKTLQSDQTEHYLDEIAAATGSGRSDQRDATRLWMSWDMVRELRDAGMTIGGHTDSHPILARLSEARQKAEIDTCANRMLQELEDEMAWFAYPVGDRDTFTPATQRLLSERGVELAFSFYGGFASFNNWTPLDIPRMHVGVSTTASMLQAALILPTMYARA